PAKIVLDAVGIARLDEAHGHRLAAARAQQVGMLAEIVEAEGSHGSLQVIRRKPAPLCAGGAGSIGGSSSPPERLVEFVGDVGGGHADVVQVPFGPFGKLAPRLVALAPDMDGLSQSREKAMPMMIYHRFVGENGHFLLLYLICWR